MTLTAHHPGFDEIDEVRRFREGIYRRDGVTVAPTDWMDTFSWHILAYDNDGSMVGCLRYLPMSASWAWASGLAASEPGVGVRLIREGVLLSRRLGHMVLALATRRHRAAELLTRMGCEVVEEYDDPLHGRMALLKF